MDASCCRARDAAIMYSRLHGWEREYPTNHKSCRESALVKNLIAPPNLLEYIQLSYC